MKPNKRFLPLTEAFLVTFLWSTSFILIKIGLEEIDPLSFSTYRYGLASLILVLLSVKFGKKNHRNINLRRLAIFLLLGFTGYFLAQGLQFFSLFYLSPVTVSFILNLTPISVVILSTIFLKEKPSIIQFLGILVSLFGIFIYFLNIFLSSQETIWVVTTFIAGFGWAVYMIISRHFLKEDRENVLQLTAYSMALGSIMLFTTKVFTGDIVMISSSGWLIILWLSITNTALAFILWNHALKMLRAYEQSILQNTMLIQITLLSNIFLNELITFQETIGIIIVFIGVLIVQIRYILPSEKTLLINK
jgi:drug/metabolite transporter (DMT)-like permease